MYRRSLIKPCSLSPTAAPISRRELAALGAIVLVGLVLRLAYFLHAVHTAGFAWEDPDGYMAQAVRLVRHGRWAWTFAATTYSINGQVHALPPGYSVFLSLFAMFPGFPLTAEIAQVLVAVLSIPLVFALGVHVHSARAGLIAAACYAVWAPNILNVWSTSQETLYIPLILASFVLLARAINRQAGAFEFAAAGVMFGLAALTRSMPLFFVWPAALMHAAFAPAPARRRTRIEGVAFLAGFLIVVVPYSAALSRYFGALTIIDTHGSIHLDATGDRRAPSLFETARALGRTVTTSPVQYFYESIGRARSLLQVNGGRILQIYVVAATKSGAAVWKVLIHLGTDALLILAVAIAPIGAALCRRPRIAAMLLLWTAINMIIASVGGFGGARLRTPFEPLLMILAAVPFAGSWRHPSLLEVPAAAILTGLALTAVVPQIPQTLRAWPDYGVKWPSIFNRTAGQFTGAAGLNVPAPDGAARLNAISDGDSAVQLRVRVNGVLVRTVQLPPGDVTTIHALWPARGLAFVELNATGPAGNDATVRLKME